MSLTQGEVYQLGQTFIRQHGDKGYEINDPNLKARFHPTQQSYENLGSCDLEIKGRLIGRWKKGDQWEEVTHDNTSILFKLDQSTGREIEMILVEVIGEKPFKA
jgi:hypothetical protein